jgi:hypothetical protein
MNGPVEWFGAIGAIVASGLLAGDLGRRVTGWAFVLFMAVALAWVASGIVSRTWPLVIQNAILLVIDSWGAWQFLLDPHKRRVIEKQEELAEEAEAEVAAEERAAPLCGATK